MYGHDGAGPVPSLYIGATVPMIPVAHLVFELHDLTLNNNNNNKKKIFRLLWIKLQCTVLIFQPHIYFDPTISLCCQNWIRMQTETENWNFRMYGHDSTGPVPSLYIGTTVPMILNLWLCTLMINTCVLWVGKSRHVIICVMWFYAACYVRTWQSGWVVTSVKRIGTPSYRMRIMRSSLSLVTWLMMHECQWIPMVY